jgi:hypothetical protein
LVEKKQFERSFNSGGLVFRGMVFVMLVNLSCSTIRPHINSSAARFLNSLPPREWENNPLNLTHFSKKLFYLTFRKMRCFMREIGWPQICRGVENLLFEGWVGKSERNCRLAVACLKNTMFK